MANKTGVKALIPNPALKPFEVLAGEWQISASHPFFSGVVLHGRASFEFIEGGAFLIMHSHIDHPKFPDGVAVFGSDDAEKKFFMLYFDERGISRKYDVSFEGNKLAWWRDDSQFSQRMTVMIEEGGNKLVNKGEMKQEGKEWEKDLESTYTRIK